MGGEAMRVRSRLDRLDQRIGPQDCPVCQDRVGRLVFTTARVLPDGSIVSGEDAPAPCTVCGKVPEMVIEVAEILVETASEAREALSLAFDERRLETRESPRPV
jgi:hypothetical protein